MALFGNNAGQYADAAREALGEGLPVYVTVLHSVGSLGTPDGAHQVRAEWSQRVAETTSAGWRLEHWAVGSDHKGRPEAYPVFRRG